MKDRNVRILCLPGDGIGPELINACLPILQYVAAQRGHTITLDDGIIGWAAYDVHKKVMPEVTWRKCEDADAILFGAVGLPKRDHELPPNLRPERAALLPLRQRFGLGCNIRPIIVYPELADLSPLKAEYIGDGIKLTFFRELLGGDYFGAKEEDPNGQWALDVCRYEKSQIELIARAAFAAARVTGDPVVSIDKANVLKAMGTYWRTTVQNLHDREYPEVTLTHEYVDAFNAYLISRPSQYRFVLTPNSYGDILSDGAAALAGSIGLLPSASINLQDGFALYEPGGGSAPDIAGEGIANPIAMILSIAMMFRHTFNDSVAAEAIEEAVKTALKRNLRTPDIARGNGTLAIVSTQEMAVAIYHIVKEDLENTEQQPETETEVSAKTAEQAAALV